MQNALIVEDSGITRMYYREILEGSGFKVEEAFNGIEGLEKSMVQAFDLIVVDVNMPKMDGYAFLTQLRKQPDTSAVPVIMISTEAETADKVKAYTVGANSYLAKPVAPAKLELYAKLMTGIMAVEQG